MITTLFAALEVATGKVTDQCYDPKTAEEILPHATGKRDSDAGH
jgi:hypothetical protein